MRKKLWIALMLGVLVFLTQASMAFACRKSVEDIDDGPWDVLPGDGDGIVEVGEYVEFSMRIGISAYRGDDWFNVMVYDRISAELDIISIDSVSQGSVEYYRNPGGKKVKTKGATELVWHVGDLAEGEGAQLYFTVATNLNPAGKQRYTSPGTYELNSGPTLKCNVGTADGPQYSESPPTFGMPDPITVYLPD